MSVLACYDCGLPYGSKHWIEAVVANHIWNAHLSPTKNEGGILCINCMAVRAAKAGLVDVHVRLTAGPFTTKKVAARQTMPSPSALSEHQSLPLRGE